MARPSASRHRPNAQWWDRGGDGVASEDAHAQVFAALSYWDDHQSQIHNAHLLHARLYGNAEIVGFRGSEYTKATARTRKWSVAFNIIKSVCDTISARIAKNKPRPQFLSKGGDWTLQQRAKRLSKFCEGVFHMADVWATAAKCFLDATIFGAGFAHVYHDGGRIYVDRVFPDEIIVDLQEARYGEPRQIHRVRTMPAEVVAGLYPDKRKKIESAPEAGDDLTHNKDSETAALITLVESWHLPSAPGANDGRHTICVETATLLDEEYTKEFFPIAKIEWGPPVLGYWPIGLAQEITPIQRECNHLLRRIQEAMQRLAVPWIFVKKGSQVVKEHLNNMIAGVIEWTGDTPPNVSAHATVHPEVFNHLDRLYQRAYELAGVSQMSATGKKPAGLDSGAALREYNDIETERFAMKALAYEDFHMDITRLIVEAARDAFGPKDAEDNAREDIEVMAQVGRRNKFVESIRWSEVSMDDDAYELQVFPTNLLPTQPAGRLQQVKELQADGFISPEMAASLLDFPDVEAVMSLKTAPIDDMKATIERMLRDGEYFPPEPFQNLALGMELVTGAYLRGRLEGVPEDKLDLLRQWLMDAKDLLNQAAPAPAAPAAPGPAAGAPGPAGLPAPPMAAAPTPIA